jgi:tetratricopeptide (TPR) repeat protein
LKAGKLDEAENLFRESLELSRKTCPDNKAQIATMLHELGRCLLEAGKMAESEYLLRQSLDIERTIHPDNKGKIAATTHVLGRCLLNKGKPDEAEPLLRESLDTQQTSCPYEAAGIAINIRDLGSCLAAKGILDEAEKLLRESLDRIRAARPDDKVNIAMAIHCLAGCLLKKGETEEAEDLLRTSLDMKRSSTPDAKVRISETLSLLMKFLMSVGRTDEAVSLYKESRDLGESEHLAIISPPGLSKYEQEIYECAMSDGYVEVERTNIKVLGRDSVGKTCFTDSLADKPFSCEQTSTDTVKVRTMVTSLKSSNPWTDLGESGTTHYVEEAMAKGIVLHQLSTDRNTLEDEKFAAASTAAGCSVSKRREPIYDPESEGILAKLTCLLPNIFSRKRRNSMIASRNQALPECELSTRQSSSRVSSSDTELQLAAQSDGDMIRIAAASVPDEILLYNLVEKLLSDPGLLQVGKSLQIVKVWDFPGQALFWPMLVSLLPNEPSPYSHTVYMLLFKMNRLLSDRAHMSVFLDYQHGPLEQPLHWIELEGDFIRHLLMAIRVSQIHPPKDSQIFETDGVLSPAVFAVATHADEEGCQEVEKEQSEVLRQLLEDSGYHDHVVLPRKDSETMFYKVDNTKSGSGTKDESVTEICSRLQKMSHAFFAKRGRQLIPLRFMRLEKLIYKVELVLGRGLVKVEMLKQLAKRLCHILDEEFIVALKSLTNNAVLFYFPDVVQLNEFVVISPKWLFNAMTAFASVEKPDRRPSVQSDWRRLKETGIMSWQLAVHLLESHGVRKDEYGGVLQLFRLIGIVCPRLQKPFDVMSPIPDGTELFVPSLIERSEVSRDNAGVVDGDSPDLPPPLVFCPKNVDIFPEVLFFRFITFLLSKFTISPPLERYRACFCLHHDLILQVVYHPCTFVTATVSSLNDMVAKSTIAPYCSQLFQVMSEELNKARHPGMAGLELDLCVHLPSDGNIDSSKLLVVNDYRPSSFLVRRDHSPVSSLEYPSISMWFAPCSSKIIKRHSIKLILGAVLKHGSSRWHAIGTALGYSDDGVKCITSGYSHDSGKLFAIFEAKSKILGESKALEEVLTVCENITNPIIADVADELNMM